LTKTRGEILAEYLTKTKPTSETVTYFARQLAARDESLVAEDLIADTTSTAWELAREQTAFDAAKKDGWNDAAWHLAVKKARELTFQQDLQTTAQGGNHFEDVAAKLLKSRSSNKLIGYFFPFVKTPYNIFRVGLRKSPLGAANLAVQMGKGFYGMKDGSPYLTAHPDLVRDLAEQTIAWSAFALLFGAAQGDDDDDDKKLLITGSMPYTLTSRGVRDLANRDTGGDYVIRIGGRNGISIQYGRYEPIATVLGTTIDIIRGIKRNGTPRENLAQVWNYFMASVNDKSFLQGFSNLTDIAEGRSNPAGTLKRMALQALVPNLIRQPLRNLDDYKRDYKLSGMEYTMLPAGALAEPKVDIYGKEVAKGSNPIARLFFNSPLKTDATLNSADKLLLNWNRANPGDAYAPQPPPSTFKGRDGEYHQMTAEEYRKFSIAAGRLASAKLRGVIRATSITRPREEDVAAIRKAFADARSDIRERMFRGR